ncbi:hypothetical protein LJC63_10925 [Ruminococcaceae bacterium OttesenSCG-928-L11]|nr:hypothetical protein [Ruminococcaceae bacterium OttesenSCG-928-L11]
MSKYGVWAVRGGSSVFGAAEAWCKDLDGEYMVLDSQEEARKIADGYNQSHSPLASVHYYAKEMEPQLAEEISRRRDQAQEPELELSGPC